VPAALVLLSVLTQVGVGHAASVPVSSKNLAVYSTCTLSGTIAASTSEQDSFVDQNAPNTNNGNAWTMSSDPPISRNKRPYLVFDLTTCSPRIPVTATVSNATLRLWVTAMPAACRTDDVFAVSSSWTETGITWNNQPFGTSTNNPASAARTGAITLGSGGGCAIGSVGQYVPWTVTTDVAKFVAGTAVNFGWMIRDDAEDAAASATVTFRTSDSGSVPNAPQLIVTYRK
jgi:hypothetical protein